MFCRVFFGVGVEEMGAVLELGQRNVLYCSTMCVLCIVVLMTPAIHDGST